MREALEKWRGETQWTVSRFAMEELAPKFEVALRAAYIQGVEDARYTEIHRGAPDAYTDAKEGVTAGIEKFGEET
ncbi:MAG: hypothetical protein V3R16_09555 [Nitrospirales bacterium]